MDCSMPGFPVHHQYPELTQTHLHHVGDAIQPSHPLSSPSICVKHILWGTLSKVIEIGQSGDTEIYVSVYKFIGICHLLSRRLRSFDDLQKKKKRRRPPSIFSSIRVFSNESVFCIRWPKYWRVSEVAMRNWILEVLLPFFWTPA